MTFLISLLTNKYTWYAIGCAVLSAWLYFGVWQPYQHMKAQAALVPGLIAERDSYKSQIVSDDKRVAAALVAQKIAEGQRDQARADLAAWNKLKTGLDTKLDEMVRNASASKNPVCMPSPDERRLFNDILATLTGGNTGNRPTGTAGQVPEGAGGIH